MVNEFDDIMSVPWGLVVDVSRLWRCAVVIAGEGVVWVELCHWDCWVGRRVGTAVSLGLLIGGRCVGGACGWRRVIGIAGQGVVWVALCYWD